LLTPCADGLFFAVRQAHSSALIALSAVASAADARDLDASRSSFSLERRRIAGADETVPPSEK